MQTLASIQPRTSLVKSLPALRAPIPQVHAQPPDVRAPPRGPGRDLRGDRGALPHARARALLPAPRGRRLHRHAGRRWVT